MLCKISMAPFPLIILLYAWWKRGRLGWNDLKVSLPFFLVSIELGAATILAGESYSRLNHMQPDILPLGGFFFRMALAGQTMAFYFSHSFLPLDLTPAYPAWTVNPYRLVQFLPWLVLGGVICWLWSKRETWGRHVLLGLGSFFLLNLGPFLGFLAISYMAMTWVFDHHLYSPIIGLIGLVVAALGRLEGLITPSLRLFGSGIIALTILIMALESHSYTRTFIDAKTLWSHVLARNPNAWPAYYNLGYDDMKRGDLPEAIEMYQKAIQLQPGFGEVHTYLGLALGLSGRIPEALAQYQEALRIKGRRHHRIHRHGGYFREVGKAFCGD